MGPAVDVISEKHRRCRGHGSGAEIGFDLARYAVEKIRASGCRQWRKSDGRPARSQPEHPPPRLAWRIQASFWLVSTTQSRLSKLMPPHDAVLTPKQFPHGDRAESQRTGPRLASVAPTPVKGAYPTVEFSAAESRFNVQSGNGSGRRGTEFEAEALRPSLYPPPAVWW